MISALLIVILPSLIVGFGIHRLNLDPPPKGEGK